MTSSIRLSARRPALVGLLFMALLLHPLPAPGKDGFRLPATQLGSALQTMGSAAKTAFLAGLGLVGDLFSPSPAYACSPDDRPVLISPVNGARVGTWAPTLQASSGGSPSFPTGPDGPVGGGGSTTYQFTITTPTGGVVIRSPWSSSSLWTVPTGVLWDGAEYDWYVQTNAACYNTSDIWSFSLDVQRLGTPEYYPMQGFSLGAAASASVNIATGNLVADQTDASLSMLDPPVMPSRTYNSRGAGKPVYVDDSFPYGASVYGSGYWDSGRKWSGSTSLRVPTASGVHQHYFENAQGRLFVPPGSTLVAYAYLDPGAVPREVMLQFWVGDGSGWEHRAYWGENLIPWGTDGTASRRRIGNLPQAGQWVRLEVPAAQIGLEGKTVAGVAYSLYNGQTWFDKTYLGTGAVGYGWTIGFDLALPGTSYTKLIDHSSAGYMELIDVNGDTHFFYPTGNPDEFATEAGEFATIRRIADPNDDCPYIDICLGPADLGDWDVRSTDGLRFQFSRYTGELVATWLPERKDGTGFTYSYQSGRLTSIRDRLGRQVSFEYDAENRLLRVKADFDSGRVLATYEYDGHDQLRAATDALGNRTEYTYDPVTHDLLTVTTPRGIQSPQVGDFQTTFVYQAALAGEEYRRVVEVRRPHTEGGPTTNLVTSFSYTPASRTSKVTLPKGVATPSNPNDFITTYEYNDRGNPTRTTDAAGNAVTMTWNSQNLVTSITDREGATSQYAYDGNGNLCEQRLPVNNSAGQPAITRHFFDEFAAAYTCSPTTKPAYNLRTRVVDPEGRTTTYEYMDPAGSKPWVTRITAGAGTPEAAATTSTYYSNSAEPWRYSKVKTKTMPKGNAPGCDSGCASSYTATYDYWGPNDVYSFPGDPSMANMPQQGWLKSRSQPGDVPIACGGSPATSCRHYDRYGNEVHALDAKGDHYRLHDLKGGVIKTQSLGTTGVPDPARWVQFFYDADGNSARVIDSDIAGDQTAFGYDDLNRLTGATDAWGTTTTYSYDANGNVATETTSGIGTVTYTYDALDRLATLSDPQNRVTTYAAYDREGRLLEKRLPNSTHTHYRYNAAGWPTAQENRQGSTHSPGEGVVADYAYTYDGSGQVLTETRPDGQLTYRYDSLGRLYEVIQGGTTRRYAYDRNSNRIELRTNGSLTNSYTHNALDQLLEIRNSIGALTDSFTYNSAGEMELHSGSGFVRTYTYNAEGQTIREEQAGATVSYAADGLNRVIQETERNSSGSVTSDLKFGYGGAQDSRLYERDAASGSLRVSYVTDSDGLLEARESTRTTFYYLSGHGDIVQKADQAGVLSFPIPLAYDEFGGVSTDSGSPYGYAGLWQRDTSSLTRTIRMGARLYDPALGRFLAKDPIEGGSLNSYDYAGQNPITSYDLDGMCRVFKVEQLVGPCTKKSNPTQYSLHTFEEPKVVRTIELPTRYAAEHIERYRTKYLAYAGYKIKTFCSNGMLLRQYIYERAVHRIRTISYHSRYGLTSISWSAWMPGW